MKGIRLLVAAVCLLVSSNIQAKTLVFCYEGNPETLNPQVASTALGTNAARPVFDNLVQFRPGTTDIVPGLAETWSISADGKTYIFHLRPGVRFHTHEHFAPTRTLNADDVLFSFNRQWRADNPFHTPADGKFDYFEDLGLGDLLDGIDKIDDLTVRFRLKRPEAPFLTDLTMPFTMILSQEYADAMLRAGTPDRLDSEPIGTGPFVFEAFQKDILLRYGAFPDYWGGRPQIDTLVLSITSNAAVRLNKLKSGECQIMALPSPHDVERIRDDPQLTLLVQDGLNISYLALNATKPPFDDPRVRRAVRLAIDRATLVPAVFGSTGIPIKNPLPVNMWSYDEATQDDPYDPAAAQRLMIDAGLAQGFDTELWYMPISRPYNPSSKQMAEMMAEDLSHVGIRAKLVTADWATYRAKLQAGETPMALYGWIGDNGDPDNFLAVLFGCHNQHPGPGNIVKWCDPAFDQLMADGKQQTDHDGRSRIYKQAQAMIHEHAVVVPIAQSPVFMAMRRAVRGFQVDPLGRYFFNAVHLDD